MKIKKITENKKQYLPLLLLADEEEHMIDRYINNGEMFALFDDDLRAICIVTDEGNRTCELKNLATEPKYQKLGYGRKLINYITDYYSSNFDVMLVGTGDTPKIIPFYEKCGFQKSHIIKNFFTDNYSHPIIDAGVQLIDMVYLRKALTADK